MLENKLMLSVKRRVKHLHKLLKKDFDEVSLSYCYNAFSRMSGAQDWNTLCALIKTGEIQKKRAVMLNALLCEEGISISTIKCEEIMDKLDAQAI
jgi:hypothetical protein